MRRPLRAAAVAITALTLAGGMATDAAAAPADEAATRVAPEGSSKSVAEAPTGSTRVEVPSRMVLLSSGSGQMVRLPRPITSMFIADDKIADVQVKSPTQLYLFGKTAGQTSVFATDKAGAVVWSSEVRVGNNIAGVAGMLKVAMPDANVTATPLGNMMLLTGTVASPKEIEEAEHLTTLFIGGTTPVVNRIRTATPMQVALHVRIAEVNRDFVKKIGVNLATRDRSGGTVFNIGQGTPGSISTVTGPGDPSGLAAGSTLYNFAAAASGMTAFGLAGHALGLDILSSLDAGETDGMVTTLAEPNLTALSGESASFLAGGEIPIPIGQGLGAVSVEYKQYGVSLSFTPVVLSNGRISLKVKPEVSQLTASSVTLGGYAVPGISTQRAETTVELGTGQSFMIGGLLNNNTSNTTDKVPALGTLPIIGALFRSNSFRHQQTELVIVVTPYLVQPTDAAKIALPTDGYKAPTDAERVLLGKTYSGAAPAAGGQ